MADESRWVDGLRSTSMQSAYCLCILLKVGKSYGTLGSKDREKYENKNCNAVAKGVNPSCDDVCEAELSTLEQHITVRLWCSHAVHLIC